MRARVEFLTLHESLFVYIVISFQNPHIRPRNRSVTRIFHHVRHLSSILSASFPTSLSLCAKLQVGVESADVLGKEKRKKKKRKEKKKRAPLAGIFREVFRRIRLHSLPFARRTGREISRSNRPRIWLRVSVKIEFTTMAVSQQIISSLNARSTGIDHSVYGWCGSRG